jgi:hypothetical protein
MAKLAVRKQAAVGTGDSDQAIWLQVVCQQLSWKVSCHKEYPRDLGRRKIIDHDAVAIR